jgi:hypothetical protein
MPAPSPSVAVIPGFVRRGAVPRHSGGDGAGRLRLADEGVGENTPRLAERIVAAPRPGTEDSTMTSPPLGLRCRP